MVQFPGRIMFKERTSVQILIVMVVSIIIFYALGLQVNGSTDYVIPAAANICTIWVMSKVSQF